MMKKLGILHVSDIHIVDASSITEVDIIVEKLLKDIKKVESENDIQIVLLGI